MSATKKSNWAFVASIAVFTLLALTACAAPAAFSQSAPQTPAPAAAPDPALPHGQIQYLWPSGAPGAVGAEEQDKPHLEIFTGYGPAPHTAVVVCPGGGYRNLAYEKEGTQIAEWLNLRGITAFVLTYRLTPRYHYPEPILDGYRSVRWVRSHAAEYHVAPDRIGMWGFSAGGHLVGMVGTHFDDGNLAGRGSHRSRQRPPRLRHQLLRRPHAAARHRQARRHGESLRRPSFARGAQRISPDLHVTPRTPPFFLYATTPDQSVPVLSAVVVLYRARQSRCARRNAHLSNRPARHRARPIQSRASRVAHAPRKLAAPQRLDRHPRHAGAALVFSTRNFAKAERMYRRSPDRL